MAAPQTETVKSSELIDKIHKKYAGKHSKETISEIVEAYNKGIHETLSKGKRLMIFGVLSLWVEKNPAKRYLALPIREIVVGKDGWRISVLAGKSLTSKLNSLFERNKVSSKRDV